MAKRKYASVAEYIATQPKGARGVLSQVRSVIRKALPKADEVISYQIPAYKLNGRIVIYFAGWKHHYSIYPATKRLVTAFTKELSPYEVNNKGTIRFRCQSRSRRSCSPRLRSFARRKREKPCQRPRRNPRPG